MDTIFDIWLADRRLHRRARTAVRRSLVEPESTAPSA
jgi:hypothetical protein